MILCLCNLLAAKCECSRIWCIYQQCLHLKPRGHSSVDSILSLWQQLYGHWIWPRAAHYGGPRPLACCHYRLMPVTSHRRTTSSHKLLAYGLIALISLDEGPSDHAVGYSCLWSQYSQLIRSKPQSQLCSCGQWVSSQVCNDSCPRFEYLQYLSPQLGVFLSNSNQLRWLSHQEAPHKVW
jgi:hypothetical protein